MKVSSPRVLELEGLRGLAALGIFLSHLRLFLFSDAAAGLEKSLFGTYLFSLFDGSFSVCIFFVLSGYVLSLKTDRKQLVRVAALRYPRLAVPVLVSVLLTHLLWVGGLFSHIELGAQLGPASAASLPKLYAFEPSWPFAFRLALWNSFFAFDVHHTYNIALWTMEPEYLGSLYLIFFLGCFARHRFYGGLAILSGLWLFFIGVKQPIAFLLGSLIAQAFKQDATEKNFPAWPAVALLIGVGACLPNYFELLHVCLATLTLLGVVYLRPIKTFLRWRGWVFLGRISFAIYLTHWTVFCVFGFPLYEPTRSIFLTALGLSLLVGAVSLVFTIAILEPIQRCWASSRGPVGSAFFHRWRRAS